jgi:hypothetical protein
MDNVFYMLMAADVLALVVSDTKVSVSHSFTQDPIPRSGLPDDLFSNQKSLFGGFFWGGGLAMENIGIWSLLPEV